MSLLKETQQYLAADFKLLEKELRKTMQTPVGLLDLIIHYIIRRKGKQMRPMFVFLAAKMHGEINSSSINAAVLVEILHTATLVHDDVVDDAQQRRGFWSINAIWKNKIAVLVGDYLLSKGLLMAVAKKEFNLLEIVSNAVKALSEGELLQIQKTRKLNITEEVYYEIIQKKTASLIAACCQAGAASVSKDIYIQQQMYQFGELTGMAFQIKDDLFDYGQNASKIGKAIGNDLKEKKITLPLIYTLNQLTTSEQKIIKKEIHKKEQNKKMIAEIISLVTEKKGLQYAQEKMQEFYQKANQILDQFEKNKAQENLKKVLLYTIERDH